METIQPNLATRVFLYARVSLDEGGEREQNPEVQLAPLRAYYAKLGKTIEHEFIDKESGASLLREDFRNLLNVANKPGDEIGVFKLDRLARFKAIESMNLILGIGKRGVSIHSLNDQVCNVINPTPYETLTMFLIFWVAELERYNTSIRTAAGVALEKDKKEYRGGRPKGRKDAAPRERRWQKKPELDVHDLLTLKKL